MDYHALVRSSALFIQALEETQQKYRFAAASSVYDSLASLQALWASRRPVSLSFFLSFYFHTSLKADCSDSTAGHVWKRLKANENRTRSRGVLLNSS